MSTPKAFQKATIERALIAFHRRRHVRRFLVADEVGLGKTVVARGVIERLMHRNQTGCPLRVFYVCSSLAIAAQNKDSLLKVIQDPAVRARAASDVDRLTLAPNQQLSGNVPLHLFTLTPGTSIPDRKGMRRTGTVEERALLHNLLASQHPSLTKIGRQGEEWLRRNAVASWEDWKQWSGCRPSPSLRRAFFPILRKQLGLKPRQDLPSAISRKLREDRLETIGLLRVALAKTGLAELAPDLIIFDEFQRFQDLLDSDDGGSAIAQEMVQSGPDGPAVLLLSATPYRLYGGDTEHLFGEVHHHEQFFSLVKWLYGGDQQADEKKFELQKLFLDYGDALRSTNPSGHLTLTIKEKIESRLRPVIARTERFAHQAGQDAAELTEVLAPLKTEDLDLFRHMVRCFEGNSQDHSVSAGTSIAYWSSVPLPMQTLGPEYKAWDPTQRFNPTSRALRLSDGDIREFRGPANWPHPKLRALRAHYRPENLAVPWLSPSLPWWPLSKRWSKAPAEKALLFSRFRAVPRAVAGLMSYELERHLLRRAGMEYREVTKKTLLGPQRENLAFFHPSLVLARFVDPWNSKAESVKHVNLIAEEQTEAALIRAGIEIDTAGRRSRPLPELLVLLERRVGAWDRSLEAWRRLATSVSRTESAGETSLRSRVDQWDAAVHGQLETVNRRELATLSKAALCSPGSILARSLLRHKLTSNGSVTWRYRALRVSWEGLRSYFNNPWMAASMTGRGNYRGRISKAILDGNLESVLDEHLWVTATLRHLGSEALLDNLTIALSLRTSDVKFYGYNGRKSDYYLRSHAALPFNEAIRRHRPVANESNQPTVRTDEVRIAFNSPFWPYVLATTSVGQEGLDFHTWCSTIAHWDLPGNPVDLEQREGRIDRYAGLSTRRAIAAKGVDYKCGAVIARSPWEMLAEQVEQIHRDDPVGLAPWWIVEGTRIKRIVFDVPLSEARARFEDLRQQRLLYRLTLGQPNQADLVKALHDRVSQEEIIAATINLSARCPST